MVKTVTMKFVRDQKSQQTCLGAPRQKPCQQEATSISVARISLWRSVTTPRHAPQVQQFLHTTQHFTQNVSEHGSEVLQKATDGTKPPEQWIHCK